MSEHQLMEIVLPLTNRFVCAKQQVDEVDARSTDRLVDIATCDGKLLLGTPIPEYA